MVDWIALTLAILSFLCVVLISVQLRQAFLPRNNPFTLRNGILSLLALSALLRMAFWIKVCTPTTEHSNLVLTFYFLPVWLEFFGLSLLAVFYADNIWQDSYSKYSNSFKICLLINFIFGVLNIVITVLSNNSKASDSSRHAANIVYVLYGSCLAFLLAGALSYLGRRFLELQNMSHNLSKKLLPRSIKWFRIVNSIVVITYILRGIFIIILDWGLFLPESQGEVVYEGDHPMTPVTILIFSVIGEFIPAIGVVVLLWRKSNKTSPLLRGRDTIGGCGDGTGSGTSGSHLYTPLHGQGSDTRLDRYCSGAGSTPDDEEEDNRLNTRLLSEEDAKISVVYNDIQGPIMNGEMCDDRYSFTTGPREIHSPYSNNSSGSPPSGFTLGSGYKRPIESQPVIVLANRSNTPNMESYATNVTPQSVSSSNFINPKMSYEYGASLRTSDGTGEPPRFPIPYPYSHPRSHPNPSSGLQALQHNGPHREVGSGSLVEDSITTTIIEHGGDSSGVRQVVQQTDDGSGRVTIERTAGPDVGFSGSNQSNISTMAYSTDNYYIGNEVCLPSVLCMHIVKRL